MKIVHVLTRFLRGGSEENTVATCLWQLEAGHEVTIIHGSDFDLSWYDEVPRSISLISVDRLVHRISPINDVLAYREIVRLLRQLSPDVVHTHQSKAGFLARAAARSFVDIISVHGLHIVNFLNVNIARKALYIWIEKLAASWTDVFIAVSRSVAEAYADVGVVDRDEIEIVYSGMDINRFRNANQPEDIDFLVPLRDNAKDFVIVMVAAFEKRKRHIEFLTELAARRNELPEFRLLLVGDGPQKVACEQRAQALGLCDAVVFCGYRMDPERLIAVSDLCVLTSEREGLPRTLIQYLACGKPIVTTDAGDFGEVIGNGFNAVVSGPSIRSAVDEIVALSMDERRMLFLADNASRTDLSEWTLEALGRRSTEVYVQARKTKSRVRGVCLTVQQ